MDHKNLDDWPQSEQAQGIARNVRHSYRLTLPELSAAREVAYRAGLEARADGEAPHQQTNVPYLLLLTMIFLINGFILFFGPAFRDKFDFLNPVPPPSTSVSEAAWRDATLDWTRQTEGPNEWMNLNLWLDRTVTTYHLSSADPVSSESRDSSQGDEMTGVASSKPETNLFR